ncbi:MAG: GNAT family N-acetyltransferase [Pirellulaceae bacterium]|nr:GNAT family N-acetyltransferase [Pirellulaceae bacterium]
MTAAQIIVADLNRASHQNAVLSMLDQYSADPMGDEQPLSEFARANLIEGLRRHPTTLIFLAWKIEHPVGIAVCFRGFSTFAAKPLINLHDFYVNQDVRGQGIGRLLLSEIEREALASGCCKLTLEVQQNNDRARAIYAQFGFAQAVYAADVEHGGSLFMTKPLE